MRYRQNSPSAALGRYVECFWSLEYSNDDSCAQQRIVADGRAEIVLHLGEPASMLDGVHRKKQHRSFLAGQITRPLLLLPAPSSIVVGIRLRPAAGACWLGVPMNEFTDQMAGMETFPKRLRRALDCFDSDEPEVVIRALDRELSGWLPTCEPSAQVEHAVELLMRSRGAIRVEEVAAETNLSRRQLERQFLRHLGLTPKAFARVTRFQNVFQAYESERDWVAVAQRCGYYDQAHLIQDFRELAGEPPAKLLARESDLAHVFLQASHFSKTGTPSTH